MKLVHGTAAQIAASDFMATLSRGLFRLLIIVGRSPALSVLAFAVPALRRQGLGLPYLPPLEGLHLGVVRLLVRGLI